MDNIQTMNLAGDDSDMVPIDARSHPQQQKTDFREQPKIEAKNISTDNNNKQEMDSATPLDEVMGLNDLSNAPLQQDPRMVPQQAQMMQAVPQQVAMAPEAAMAPAAAAGTPPPQVQSKNPMNLTDDQMEALFVGVVAVIAFSKPVQEKLAQMIPQFTGENGARSTVGIAISGLVAALVYFFGRRFIMKN